MLKYILLFLPALFWGQIPNYYSSIDFNTTQEQLKIQLAELITETHTYNLSYTPGVWNAVKQTDLDPTNSDNVLLIYSHENGTGMYEESRDKDLSYHGNGSDDGKWTREHVYARSLGTPNLGFENAGADAHALRACDANVNSWRSNRRFADGEGNSHITPDGDFYPGDRWKGDIARILMYMYLRYPSQCLTNNTTIGPKSYSEDIEDILLEWNAEDPPSQYEKNRNDILEEYFQGNRNPFIDNPYLATLIWGGPEAENTWGSLGTNQIEENIEFSFYPNPTHDYIYYTYDWSSILIYDAYGKLVSKDKTTYNNKTKLPYTSGIYFIEFCNKNNSCINKKVIKK